MWSFCEDPLDETFYKFGFFPRSDSFRSDSFASYSFRFGSFRFDSFSTDFVGLFQTAFRMIYNDWVLVMKGGIRMNSLKGVLWWHRHNQRCTKCFERTYRKGTDSSEAISSTSFKSTKYQKGSYQHFATSLKFRQLKTFKLEASMIIEWSIWLFGDQWIVSYW